MSFLPLCLVQFSVLCKCLSELSSGVYRAVSGQAQSFVVRPTDVTVIEGQTAVLHCQVAHMKGQLQWTKDGFALGEIRSDQLLLITDHCSGPDATVGPVCVSVCVRTITFKLNDL